MQQWKCPICSSLVNFGTGFCANCGSQLSWPAQPAPVYQQPQQQQWASQQPVGQIAYGQSQQQNTSGTGSAAVLPAELRHWNWGAFFLNWIWGIFNKTWIAFLCFVPIVNVVMIFVLGAKGNEWAWQNNKWENAQHFQKTQKAWAHWGVGLFFGFMALYAIIAIVTAAALRR